jgi:hypothetical protein
MGDHLGAEADADDGHVGLVGLADEVELAGHPPGRFGHVLGAAQDEKGVHVVEIRGKGGVAIAVGPSDVELEGVIPERGAQSPGMLDVMVLEGEDSHAGGS